MKKQKGEIMKNKFLIIVMTAVIGFVGLNFAAEKITAAPAAQTKPAEIKLETKTTDNTSYISVCPLEVVANPEAYLGKSIKMKATFDKFATLGLDYKPAFRSSQDYISFLIKRDDVTDHTIPLSEMKIFIKRTEAEKFIDLDSGDVIDIYGKVFSTALSDPWIDVTKLVVVQKKNPDKKKA